MKSMLLSLFSCLVLSVTGQAQQEKGRLDIQLNKNILQPGDSLVIKVEYKDGRSQLPDQSLATLELIVENEQGQRTRLRWPLINGQASGALYLSDSLPRGQYTLLAGLQRRFFEVRGKIQEPQGNGTIQAMLLTKTGDWDDQEVPVDHDGTFAIRNWLFEDNALLAFAGTRNNSQPLNISISTQLDSSYRPLAVAGRAFYIGNPPAAARSILSQPVATSGTDFEDKGSVLPAVLVRTTVKSPAQQFNDEYVSGLFRSGDERMISIMDDPTAFSQPNIFSYLQGRVAGLQISPAGFSGGIARWRGSPVTFFIDEVRVSAQQVGNIPMTDIAIVKAYPPPFFGAPGGGGAIAIYTRRGGEANYLPANRSVFKIRGYTPSATVLDMNRLSL
ncbi:hypothetical protein EXU57_17045 [Segetibacter sp. 3557_3]|uniref:hypothetical protein n=1 Tax=Segetibacter sp. 3557_3 TaxID=2547429 RepID=UPI0010584C90|nr:hypothetical protein [Segetibacter sp. 3557_3]TDH23508.1 hypothetical protein EXU57_17045 [Segetibacter sp. 3557_3]